MIPKEKEDGSFRLHGCARTVGRCRRIKKKGSSGSPGEDTPYLTPVEDPNLASCSLLFYCSVTSTSIVPVPLSSVPIALPRTIPLG